MRAACVLIAAAYPKSSGPVAQQLTWCLRKSLPCLATRAGLGKISRNSRVQFGGGVTFYKQLELLDSGVRSGKLYVEYKNTGHTETSTACIKVKVYANGDT